MNGLLMCSKFKEIQERNDSRKKKNKKFNIELLTVECKAFKIRLIYLCCLFKLVRFDCKIDCRIDCDQLPTRNAQEVQWKAQ